MALGGGASSDGHDLEPDLLVTYLAIHLVHAPDELRAGRKEQRCVRRGFGCCWHNSSWQHRQVETSALRHLTSTAQSALKGVLLCAQPRDAELRKLDLLLTRLVAL